MEFGSYMSGKQNIGRLIWRVLAFILLIITLVYFVPAVAAQSVNKLPISKDWAYVLILCAVGGLFIAVESFFNNDKFWFAGLLWVMSLAWLVAFGIFAGHYMNRGTAKNESYKGTNTKKMKVGTWVLAFDTVWWAMYATFFTFIAWKARRAQRKGVVYA